MIPTPDTRRQAGLERLAAALCHAASEARQETADRAARHRAAFERINAAAGAIRRKAMTAEERGMFDLSVLMATTDRDRYEELRAYEDESQQTTRLDVLRSRAFHKARADRAKHGWL